MQVIPQIVKATPLPNYKMFVEFVDGISGEIDLHNWVGKGVFTQWNDENNFKIFFITRDKKLQWTEDIDMDPDAFYLQLINQTFDEYTSHQQLLRHTY